MTNGSEAIDEEFDDADSETLNSEPTTAAPPIKPRGIFETYMSFSRPDLDAPPANAQNPNDTEDHIKALQSLEKDKLAQEHDQRRNFFRWAVTVITLTLAGNFMIFGLYLKSQWFNISDSVMIAWIGATVVEVLGIAYIIATHLYPKGDKSGRRSSD